MRRLRLACAALGLVLSVSACQHDDIPTGSALKTFDSTAGGGVVGPTVGQTVYILGPYLVNGSQRPVVIRSLRYLDVPACMQYVGARTYLPNQSGGLSSWQPRGGYEDQPDLHYHPSPLEGATLAPGQGLPHHRFVMSRFKVVAPGSCDFHGPAVVEYQAGGKTYAQKLPVVMQVRDASRS